MTAKQFAAALRKLGWSQEEAADKLGVPGGQPRISDWTRGRLDVPPYIAASVRTHIELQECERERERLRPAE